MPLENGEYVFDISDWGFSEEVRFALETEVDFANLQNRNRMLQSCVGAAAIVYEKFAPELYSYLVFLQEVVGMLRMDWEDLSNADKMGDRVGLQFLRLLWSALLRARLVADIGIGAWFNALTYKGIQLLEKERKEAGQLGLFLYSYLPPKADSSSQKKSSVFPEIFRLSEPAVHCLKILNDAANGIKHPKTYNAWRSLRREPTVIFWPKGKKQPLIQPLDALITGLYCFVLRLLEEDYTGKMSNVCVATF